jgi:hypothetical protein
MSFSFGIKEFSRRQNIGAKLAVAPEPKFGYLGVHVTKTTIDGG